MIPQKCLPVVLANLTRRGRDGGRSVGISTSTADRQVTISLQGRGRSAGHEEPSVNVSVCVGEDEGERCMVEKERKVQAGLWSGTYVCVSSFTRFGMKNTFCLKCSILSVYKTLR
jgi:hypothetical protein